MSVGPNQFPEGVRVCSDIAALNTTVTFNWTDGLGKFTSSVGADTYINLRDNTLDVVALSIPAGECRDAYFEVEINRDSGAYDNSRLFTMTADDGATPAVSTPVNREVYIEHLISQSRNEVTSMEIKLSTDPISSYASIAAGGSVTLVVGETYHIKLLASTATQGYEQLESFINFSNIIFQVNSVSTTYTAESGLGSVTSSELYSDACIWDEDTTSANYRSCQLVGKAGGDIESVFAVTILQIPGSPLVNPQPLTTLVHDYSGSSYHYNADFSSSVRYAFIVGSTIEKSFVPKNISPGDNSTLTFTIDNPSSTAISSVNFIDNFPAGLEIEGTSVSYTGCGGAESPASLTDGDTSLMFSGISIAGFGECTIAVTVTAPAEGTYNNVTGNLFIGLFDTLSTASDTLVVTDLPAPPSTCTTKTSMVTWSFPNTNISFDDPPGLATDVGSALASTSGGTQSFVTGVTTEALALAANWPIVQGAPSTPFFQFEVDSSNYGGLEISLQPQLIGGGDWTANNNNNVYISASNDGGTIFTPLTVLPMADINKGSFQDAVSALAPVAAMVVPNTIFRVTVDTAANSPATAALDNISISGCPRPPPPEMQKVFSPDLIGIGETSTLTFSVQSLEVNEDLVGVGFSDNLPTGIVVADTPSVVDFTCSTGAIDSSVTPGNTLAGITAVANSSLIDMNEEYTLSPLADCSFSVDVKGVVDGVYINTTTNITSTFSGPNTTGGANIGYGQDTITIIPTPLIAKAFGASSVLTGATTTLTFSITNPSTGGTTLTNVNFTDTLPTGVIVGTPNGLIGSCGDDGLGGGVGTITAIAGAGSVSLSGATLLAGATCDFTVDVDATTAGLKINTTGTVSSDQGDGNTATADLLVSDPSPSLGFLKQVGTTATGPWTNFISVSAGADVYYQFTIENTGDVGLTGVDMTDDTLPGADVTGCAWVDGDAVSLAPSPFTLPIADADEGHIAICILGPYTATAPGELNTATTSNTSGATNAMDTAEYATTAVTLDKSTMTASFSAVDDVINYTYLVTNTGASLLNATVTVADDKTTVTCPAVNTVGNLDANFDMGEAMTCTASYTVTAMDLINLTVTNIATATVTNDGSPVVSNTDTVTVNGPPTAVTIGKIELNATQISNFLASLNVVAMSTDELLALLAAWSPDLAASLVDADRQTLLDALANYLDPDGDGQLAVLRWDTLEERGTIGFYVERRKQGGDWLSVSNQMLPGLITAPMGGEYQFADPSAAVGIQYEYQLIEQEARGSTRVYGPYALEIQ